MYKIPHHTLIQFTVQFMARTSVPFVQTLLVKFIPFVGKKQDFTNTLSKF